MSWLMKLWNWLVGEEQLHGSRCRPAYHNRCMACGTTMWTYSVFPERDGRYREWVRLDEYRYSSGLLCFTCDTTLDSDRTTNWPTQ